LWASAMRAELTHLDGETRFELGVPSQLLGFELHIPDAERVFDDALGVDVQAAILRASEFGVALDREVTTVEARALSNERTYYWDDARGAALPLGDVGQPVLVHHGEQAAYDRAVLADALGARVPDYDALLTARGYRVERDVFFRLTPEAVYAGAAGFFRQVERRAYDLGTQTVRPDVHALVPERLTDEVGNETALAIDYHLLAPWRLTDSNGAVHEVQYDALGVVRRSSRYGTSLDRLDREVPHGFEPLAPSAWPSFADALRDPQSALRGAETLVLYDFAATPEEPSRQLVISAEQLAHRGPDALERSHTPDRAQVAVRYLDGFGRPIQDRLRVEDGPLLIERAGALVPADDPGPRWRVSGFVETDRKQQPRREFEPLFRDGVAFDAPRALREHGVAALVTYDATGRELRRDLPNGTFIETSFASWSQTVRDPNDNIARADEYRRVRTSLGPSEPERRALDVALGHANTPTTAHLDSLGREVATTEVVDQTGRELTEHTVLDIRGLSEATLDRRLDPSGEPLVASTRVFDRLGRVLAEDSMDAGTRRRLFDAEDRETDSWRQEASTGLGDTYERRVHDQAGRMTERWVRHAGVESLVERMTYGEGTADAAARNQNGRLRRQEDGAGVLETRRFSPFGETLEVSRRLSPVAASGADPNWADGPDVEPEEHLTIGTFDALGRRARTLPPDGTERKESYLRSGGLARSTLRQPPLATSADQTVIAEAEYNARGQLTRRLLGNGVAIRNEYDPLTTRLFRRTAQTSDGSLLQDLTHHYDPVGNIVVIRDGAQEGREVIRNLGVSSERSFDYDPRYQLTGATGRVHNALMGADYAATAISGSFRGTRRLDLDDGSQVRRYRRTYTYDDGGNLTGWSHGPEPLGAPTPELSMRKLVASSSNRSILSRDAFGRTRTDADLATGFDLRGQLLDLPSVSQVRWSAREQLRAAVVIARPGGVDDAETYDYGADEVRVRKVTTRDKGGGVVEIVETIYLDGCELQRSRQAGLRLTRWLSHVRDSEDLVASLYRWDENTGHRNEPSAGSERRHYHLGTRLGSVSLELDDGGRVIAYEEYFPYGRTAFVAGDSDIEVRRRTVRFVGRNQDDATGLYSFQYRYYAPFIGNWVSADPGGEVDGPNLYRYATNNPVTVTDLDGRITREYRFIYHNLRERRGLSEERAGTLEDEVLTALGVEGSRQDVYVVLDENNDIAQISVVPRGTDVHQTPLVPGTLYQVSIGREPTGEGDPGSLTLTPRGEITGELVTAPASAAVRYQAPPEQNAGASVAAPEPEAPEPPPEDTEPEEPPVLQQTFDLSNGEHILRALGVAALLVGEQVGYALLEEGAERLGQAVASMAGGPAGAIISAILIGKTVYDIISAVVGLIEGARELYDTIVATLTNLANGTATVQEAGVAIAGIGVAVALAAGARAALRQAPDIVRAYRRGAASVPDSLGSALRGGSNAPNAPSGAARAAPNPPRASSTPPGSSSAAPASGAAPPPVAAGRRPSDAPAASAGGGSSGGSGSSGGGGSTGGGGPTGGSGSGAGGSSGGGRAAGGDGGGDASGGGGPAVRRVPQTPVGGTVDDLIAGSRRGRQTMGRTRQFDRHGGVSQANADFDALGPRDVRSIPNGGRVGTLPDGRTVVVRPSSGRGGSGPPTLEVQWGRNRIKFRFVGD